MLSTRRRRIRHQRLAVRSAGKVSALFLTDVLFAVRQGQERIPGKIDQRRMTPLGWIPIIDCSVIGDESLPAIAVVAIGGREQRCRRHSRILTKLLRRRERFRRSGRVLRPAPTTSTGRCADATTASKRRRYDAFSALDRFLFHLHRAMDAVELVVEP